MNTDNPGSPSSAPVSKRASGLLERILAWRASVGDGLNDGEITSLLREMRLQECGFSFVSYSDGFVTLAVPRQDFEKWHWTSGWIEPAKEQIAQALANKYDLQLYEPVDDLGSGADGQLHHHVELIDKDEPMIVIHPCYLKVRLFRKLNLYRFTPPRLHPVGYGPDLLQDAAVMYGEGSAPEPAFDTPSEAARWYGARRRENSDDGDMGAESKQTI